MTTGPVEHATGMTPVSLSEREGLSMASVTEGSMFLLSYRVDV